MTQEDFLSSRTEPKGSPTFHSVSSEPSLATFPPGWGLANQFTRSVSKHRAPAGDPTVVTNRTERCPPSPSLREARKDYVEVPAAQGARKGLLGVWKVPGSGAGKPSLSRPGGARQPQHPAWSPQSSLSLSTLQLSEPRSRVSHPNKARRPPQGGQGEAQGRVRAS